MESVVVAVDGAACSDIEEVAPKISSRLESMSDQTISNTVDDKKERTMNENEIDSMPSHITDNHINRSRNKLLNSTDDGRTAKADIDDGADTEHNIGCYNQSFSNSESIGSVNIDVNSANEKISDEHDVSITSSSVRSSFTKPKDSNDKEHL